MDEFNNLVFFEETSTIPTGLIALNTSLFWGCLPGHSVSYSDAIQAYLQPELKEETYVILPKEFWLPGWEERFGTRHAYSCQATQRHLRLSSGRPAVARVLV